VLKADPFGLGRPLGTSPIHDTYREGGYTMLGVLMEQLRSMGFARQLASFDEASDRERVVLEFGPPKERGIDTQIWAEQQAKRMRSFGFNAVAAPQWTGSTELLKDEEGVPKS
jgi:hypothetical protein